MSDKELDEFFREKASKSNVPYNPVDWEKMKTMLDNRETYGKTSGLKNWHRGLFIVLTGMIISIGIWIGRGSSGTATVENGNLQNTALPYQEDHKVDLYAKDSPGNSGSDTFIESEGLSIYTGEPIDAVDSANIGKQHDEKNEDILIGVSDKAVYSDEARYEKTIFTPLNEKLHSIIEKFKDEHAIGNKGNKKQLTGILRNFDRDVIPKTAPSTNQRTSLDRTKKETADFKRFSITLSVAPDVSALEIRDIKGFGSSTGLIMEYFLRQNISITTGAVYGFKTYGGSGESYGGYTPSPIGFDGECTILDLPLNFRYYAFGNSMHRWYVSTGISSYIMLREKYNLEYRSSNPDDYAYNTYTDRLDVTNKNRHYWGIVNLSAGYEKKLAEKLSLQVEPYLKLPVTGIGEGDVSLKSTGVLVGIKYSW